MKKRPFIIAVSWTAVAVCMGIIFSLSAQNGEESGETSIWLLFLLKLPVSEAFLRTAAHFLEFTGLAVLVYNALYQTYLKPRPLISFAIASAYAVTDEIHQYFVADRVCSVSDWFVDSLGALAGVAAVSLLFYIFSYIKRRRLH